MCKYGNKVVFLAVYITEAHSRDEWPVGINFSFCDQPKDQPSRCKLAKQCIDEHSYPLPLLVDTMSNQFDNEFAAWPFRFYGINHGNILGFKAQPVVTPNYAYDIRTIEPWIESQL